MMPLRRPGTPRGGDLSGHDEYAMWDAAYVLGSLSSVGRREFEAHLAGCPLCPSAIGELSGLPALLSQLDRADLAAIDEANRRDVDQLPPDELLPTLLAKVNWRRRRSAIVTWTAGAAAAAILAVGVFVGVAGPSTTSAPTPQASVAVQSMAQVGTNRLASTVSLSRQQWGTLISMNVACLAPVNSDHDKLAMVAVGRDGSHTRLASWVANPGHTAMPAGSISTPVDEIASVQVISADSGQVLLERSL